VIARRFCPSCNRNVLGQSCPFTMAEYLGHGLLILVTCGLWLVVAVPWAVVRQRRYLCPDCGARC